MYVRGSLCFVGMILSVLSCAAENVPVTTQFILRAVAPNARDAEGKPVPWDPGNKSEGRVGVLTPFSLWVDGQGDLRRFHDGRKAADADVKHAIAETMKKPKNVSKELWVYLEEDGDKDLSAIVESLNVIQRTAASVAAPEPAVLTVYLIVPTLSK